MRSFYAMALCLGFVLLQTIPVKAQTTPVDFGTLRCDSTACVDRALQISGGADTLLDFYLTAGIAFEITNRTSTSDSVVFRICTRPAPPGTYRDTLLVLRGDSLAPDTTHVEINGELLGPVLTAYPADLAFGPVAVGDSLELETVLINEGTDTIRLDPADFLPPVPFYRLDTVPVYLAPGDSLQIRYLFRPDIRGFFSGTATAELGGCDAETLVSLSGHIDSAVARGFGQIACDSTVCDTLTLRWPEARSIVDIRLRDSTSFLVGSYPSTPFSVGPDDSLRLPICVSPARRGNISDSLLVISRVGTFLDTTAYRLSAVGVGPFLTIDPIVIDFPRTSPPATVQRTIDITNSGERSFELTGANLAVPPPFALLTPLPITIDTGETVTLIIAFQPTEAGIYSEPVDVIVGCGRVLQLGLNGATDFVGTGGVLRVSKVGFNPANAERTACDVDVCTDLTLSNVGNASLRVDDFRWASGSSEWSFPVAPAFPFFIAPNDSRVIEVCIEPSTAGTFNDTLQIESNDRRPIAFGVVLDLSTSMLETIRCGSDRVRKIDEARRQAENFVANTLIDLPTLGIIDELIVGGYDTIPQYFFERQSISGMRDIARLRIQNIRDPHRSGGLTYTGRALRQMIDSLSASSLQDRVIVLLTDGQTTPVDELRFPIQSIVNAARNAGVRIFTIAYDLASDQDARDYVTALSTGSGAAAFSADDCASLQDAFAEITERVSEGTIWQEPFQMTVTAPRLVADRIDFDSLRIYGDSCATVTLTNVGEGNAVVTSADFEDLLGNATTEFYIDPTTSPFPMVIEESGQKEVSICFTPEALRRRDAVARFTYNDCTDDPTAAALTGVGVAEANLRIDDEHVVFFGDIVSLPVYGDTALAAYDVDTIRYQLQWNHSILDLRSITAGSAANGATISQVGALNIGDRYASVEVVAVGPALVSPGPLAYAEFEVLRGDTLATEVRLTAGRFQDGNPKAVLQNAGVVIYDSLCFRDLKPIQYDGPPEALKLGDVSPSPVSNGTVSITVETENPQNVRYAVYDLNGRRMTTLLTRRIATDDVLQIEVDELPTGRYWMRIEGAAGDHHYRSFLLQK